MFYKIKFKNNLTITEFKEAYTLLDSAFLNSKISQWNDTRETIDLADSGLVAYPDVPIQESIGGMQVQGEYKNKDDYFKSFKRLIVETLKNTKYQVISVSITDSQVANSQTEWFEIP